MLRPDWRVATLLGVFVVGAASWVGGVVPGGGKDAAKGNDCLVVLEGLDPGALTATGRKQTLTCSDCDPSCDADGTKTANGTCTFTLTVCTNARDVAGCEPPAALSHVTATAKVAGGGKIDLTGGRSLLEGSVCGPPTDVVVPLRNHGRKPGKAAMSLSALVNRDKATGTPKRTDKDVFQLVCVPRRSGDACPMPATTTVPSGTSTTVTGPSTSTSMTIVTTTTNSLVTTTTAATTTVTSSTMPVTTTTNTTTTTLPGTPPPDPSTVAPPVDGTVASDFASSAAFLVTSGIQTGVAPGAIRPHSVAVVRGRVVDHVGAPLSGVEVSVLRHPDLGRTITRVDGMFDLVVNGGGMVTLRYTLAGHLPVQRQVDIGWRESTVVPDVCLMDLDPALTVIQLPAAAMTVARGSPVTDGDGTRQATLLVPAGTTAEMVMPDGSMQPLTELRLRATEFTVGAMGPAAMPADLPPSSGYTYAAEFSDDQAVAAGATEVRFNQPVVNYLENFIGFPVGMRVPAASYDRGRGLWVPMDDGLVVGLLAGGGGLADLDVDGSGMPAGAGALAALGVTDAERSQLAILYAPGTALWRIPVPHFSQFDWNWSYGLAPGANPPRGKPVDPNDPDRKVPGNDPCKGNGSIIGCYDQTLGERVPVAGTPFNLHYTSDRVPGRRAASVLDVTLSDATVPTGLRRIVLVASVAGRSFREEFLPLPNQIGHIVWDGLDAYGRRLQGTQKLRGRVDYIYAAVYGAPAPGGTGRSFGSGGSYFLDPQYAANRAALEISVSRQFEAEIGTPIDARPIGLGGWTLDVHHVLEPLSGRLLLGNGDVREPTRLLTRRVAGAAILGNGAFTGDGGQAMDGRLNGPGGCAVASNGTIYVLDSGNLRVRSISTDGIIDTVAGNGGSIPNDGGPATDAGFGTPSDGIAIGPDDSIYASDTFQHRVRQFRDGGTISTLVGTGTAGFSGDGGPASAAQVGELRGLAVGRDGAVFIADLSNDRIRRVTPDGLIDTFAGTGMEADDGDGGPARQANIYFPGSLALGPDGSLYMTTGIGRVRRIAPDGIITTVFNKSGSESFSGDGGLATAAGGLASSVAVDRDGTIYFTDGGLGLPSPVIRRIDQRGIIATIAGFGQCTLTCSGDGGPAEAAGFIYPRLAIGPSGDVFVADSTAHQLRAISGETPGYFVQSGTQIPSLDGREVYIFDETGRHLQTVDPLVGTVVLQFGYDGAGRLASIADADGKVTQVERDAGGAPTAIVAPGGQRTSLTVGADGFLSTIADPAGHAVQLTYGTGDAAGLMTSFRDPNGNLHTFAYDDRGRLTLDANPAGGTTTLARVKTPTGYQVSLTTALGRMTTFEVSSLDNGDVLRRRTDSTGAATDVLLHLDASRHVTYADGQTLDLVDAPDPRWRMQAPILRSFTSRTPGGRTMTASATRTATFTDPLALSSETSTLVLNGNTYTTVYSGAARTLTLTTPGGRNIVRTMDDRARTVSMQLDAAAGLGLAPVLWSFDLAGHLHQVSQSPQSWTWAYDARNRRTSRADAAGATLTYGYDPADRRTQVVLPSLAAVGFRFDANGNRTSIQMPSGATHALGYDAVNRETSYAPPGSAPFTFTYDVDGRLTSSTLPGGRSETRTYDAAGRLTGIDDGDAAVTVGYGATHPGAVKTLTRTPDVGPAQTVTFTYDGFLVDAIDTTGVAPGHFAYDYDGAFRLSHTTFTSGLDDVDIPRADDADRHLAALGPFTFTRGGPGGAPTAVGDGTLAVHLAYDALARVTDRAVTVAGQAVHEIAPVFDVSGRVTQQTETIGGVAHVHTYTYDADGQLAEVRRDGTLVEEYAYDANGNRTSRRLNGGATEISTYDVQDRITARGVVAYQLDAAGFLTTRGADTFAYDTAGELLGATVGGQSVAYAYDAFRRRVARTDAAGTRTYYYGDPAITAEVTASRDAAGVLSVYYYDRGRLFALVRGGAWYYVATDLVGSPRVVVDATGTPVETIDYDTFGNVVADSNPGFDLPVGFAGGFRDRLTGLVRFGARDYDPAAGRWTARNPSLFDGRAANLYRYAGNDPIGLIDPSGLPSLEVSAYDGIGAGAKIAVTRDGISFCVEAGAGIGSSVEVEPMDDLDGDTFGLKGEASGGIGEAKLKGALQMDLQTDDFGKGECGPQFKGELKACGGALCAGFDTDPSDQSSIDHELHPDGAIPRSGVTDGAEAKFVVRGCQQAKW